jgi:CheY-like chemotaxis protein
MLQNLSSRLKFCLEKAAEARRRADESADARWRHEFLIMEDVWRHLAQSGDFTERLGRFCQSRRDISEEHRLPISSAPSTSGIKSDHGSKSSERPLISIIDDDEIAREGVTDLVDSLAYRTVAFATADEYLLSNLMAETSCLITDVQMPGMNGLDLHARLIADGYRTPIIFMSAFTDERARARALAPGAIGFLNKPFEEMALIECLDAALARVAV